MASTPDPSSTNGQVDPHSARNAIASDPLGAPRDARALLAILWRRRLLFALVVLVVPAGAYAVASQSKKVYQAKAVVAIQGPIPTAATLLSPTQVVVPQDDTQAVTAQAQLVTTPRMAQYAAKFLRPTPLNPVGLLPAITATADVTSGFVDIEARAPRPQRAAQLANAFANGVVEYRRSRALTNLKFAIGQVSRQLRATPSAQAQTRQTLGAQLQNLLAQRAAVNGGAQLVEPAQVPGSPASPRIVRTVVLAAIIGLLLAFGVVIFAEGIDRRIRQPEELELLTGLPLLSAIPRSAFKPKSMTIADVEAIDTLRASLTFFKVDQGIRSILVASPLQGDGKTTVAAELARSVARAGRDVILIDADLRRPRVEVRLGLGHPEQPGLGALIVGDVAVDEALVDAPAETWDVGRTRVDGGRLRILPSGPLPPNPSELLGSQRMRELLRELERTADLVVIDSSPILRMSDTFALLELVSGTLVVARMGYTTRDALRRVLAVIAQAGGSVLGVVATGGKHTARYGYGYGYGERGGRRLFNRKPKPLAKTRKRQDDGEIVLKEEHAASRD